MPSVPVVCVSVGSAYGPAYLERMVSMLRRHLPGERPLRCVTDRPDALPNGVLPIDASGWGLEGWFNKLRLFDAATTGDEPFLYLDLTLVVKASLEPLVRFGQEAKEPVVGVKDWHYDSLNSSGLWVRPGSVVQSVWDAYASGRRFATRLGTDQDYIDAVLRPQAGALGFFPEGWVASYKGLRRLHRRDPEAARRAVEKALIVKFHGEPKPHQLLDGREHALMAAKAALRHPKNLVRDWGYLRNEVREWWT